MQEDGEIVDDPPLKEPSKKKRRLHIGSVHFSIPAKAPAATADQSSDSDDEDMGEWFDEQITKTEAEIEKLGDAADAVPTEIVIRHAHITHEALVAVATAKEGLKDMLGPVPEGTILPSDKQAEPVASIAPVAPMAEMGMAIAPEQPEAEMAVQAEDSAQIHPDKQAAPIASEATPKVEEMEVDNTHVLIPTVERPEIHDEQGDVVMEDAQMNGLEASVFEDDAPTNGALASGGQLLLMPPLLEQDPATATHSPTPMEEDEEESDEEVDSVTLEMVRAEMQTPPLDELPTFATRPWFESKSFLKSMETDPNVEKFIAQLLEQNATFARADQDQQRMEYKANYEKYLRFTMSDEPIAVKSRDAFNKANTPADGSGPVATGPESKSEGRRGRFATERDLEPDNS